MAVLLPHACTAGAGKGRKGLPPPRQPVPSGKGTAAQRSAGQHSSVAQRHSTAPRCPARQCYAAMQQRGTHLQRRHEKVLGNHRHDPEEHCHPGCKREARRAGGPVTKSALQLCACCMRSSAAPAPFPPVAAMQACSRRSRAGSPMKPRATSARPSSCAQ